MRAENFLLFAGAIVVILGTVFYLQGLSVVGPESSFMYSNPQWIINGEWIIIAGVIIFAAGIVVRARISLQRPK